MRLMEQSHGDAPTDSPTPGKMAGVVLVCAVIVIVVVLGAYYFWGHTFLTGPANLGYTGDMVRVAPGSVGCTSEPGEVCYSNGLIFSYSGSVLTDLSFRVTQRTNADAQAPEIPLGSAAVVRLWNSSDTLVGVWNWSQGAWVVGSGWSIPPTEDLTFVFDTGLQSNATIASADFWTILSGAQGGDNGASLEG